MCRMPLCRATAGAELAAGAGIFLSFSSTPSALARASQICSGRSRSGQTLDGIGRAAAGDVFVRHDPRPAEEGDELMKLFTFPGLGLGIVALGALELNAEKDSACRGRNFHGISVERREVIYGRALIVGTGG